MKLHLLQNVAFKDAFKSAFWNIFKQHAISNRNTHEDALEYAFYECIEMAFLQTMTYRGLFKKPCRNTFVIDFKNAFKHGILKKIPFRSVRLNLVIKILIEQFMVKFC